MRAVISAATAVAILSSGCAQPDYTGAVGGFEQGDCFLPSETPFEAETPADKLDCGAPHQYQVIGKGTLLGEQVTRGRRAEASIACQSSYDSMSFGRKLPQGSRILQLYLGSSRDGEDFICVAEHPAPRRGSL